jgi:hypothetical protein
MNVHPRCHAAPEDEDHPDELMTLTHIVPTAHELSIRTEGEVNGWLTSGNVYGKLLFESYHRLGEYPDEYRQLEFKTYLDRYLLFEPRPSGRPTALVLPPQVVPVEPHLSTENLQACLHALVRGDNIVNDTLGVIGQPSRRRQSQKSSQEIDSYHDFAGWVSDTEGASDDTDSHVVPILTWEDSELAHPLLTEQVGQIPRNVFYSILPSLKKSHPLIFFREWVGLQVLDAGSKPVTGRLSGAQLWHHVHVVQTNLNLRLQHNVARKMDGENESLRSLLTPIYNAMDNPMSPAFNDIGHRCSAEHLWTLWVKFPS